MARSKAIRQMTERQLRVAIEELERGADGRGFEDEERERWNELNEQLEEYLARRERIAELARSGSRTEAGAAFGTDLDARLAPASRDAGLRTIEHFTGRGDLTSVAADTLDELVRAPADKWALGARYLDAVGDPHYFSAFGKLITDPTHGHLRFDAKEVEAVRRVTEAQEAIRAMSIGTTTAGGFAVPFQLDPSILLTSNGALNPIRDVARVLTVVVDQWKGVSSTGIVASYDPEASEVSDDSPTLAQPVIDCAMGRAFVPFSIELGQDWGSLQQELLQLIADARDVLDATQFLTGSGTDSPAGVLTGLTTTQRVQTAGAGAIAIGDIYALKQALPARFMPNATWAAHPNRLDSIFRLTPAGSTTEPQAMPTRDGELIGRPKIEWTTMATASSTGTKYALYGDFKAGFTIADRIGMQVELIPHLFGATNRFPTGQRGLFCYWRTGSKVVVPEALRYGEVL
jgi:HK97 family phage major capsid protein